MGALSWYHVPFCSTVPEKALASTNLINFGFVNNILIYGGCNKSFFFIFKVLTVYFKKSITQKFHLTSLKLCS